MIALKMNENTSGPFVTKSDFDKLSAVVHNTQKDVSDLKKDLELEKQTMAAETKQSIELMRSLNSAIVGTLKDGEYKGGMMARVNASEEKIQALEEKQKPLTIREISLFVAMIVGFGSSFFNGQSAPHPELLEQLQQLEQLQETVGHAK